MICHSHNSTAQTQRDTVKGTGTGTVTRRRHTHTQTSIYTNRYVQYTSVLQYVNTHINLEDMCIYAHIHMRLIALSTLIAAAERRRDVDNPSERGMCEVDVQTSKAESDVAARHSLMRVQSIQRQGTWGCYMLNLSQES